MAEQIIRTKIIIPQRRSDFLSRQRLVDLLHDLLDYRLIVVTTPPGYGKTSFLIDAAYQSDLPFCWLSLDPLDNNLHRFLSYFVAAITQQFPECGRQSAELLNSSQIDLDQFIASLINEIYETIQEYFVIVLDDYHLIDNHSEINRFISQFSQQADENVHIVLSSRSLPNLPDLPLMIARGQMGGLDFKELAFVAGEIKQLIQNVYQVTISRDAAKQLAQESEGWITGLLLSAEQFVKTHRTQFSQAYGVGLYEYLAQQVLERQSPEIQTFLLQTSVLDEFDVALCQAVFGEGPWQRLINTVRKSNLFTVTVGDNWLRYHHLFQDFLQSRLSPQDKESIQRRFATALVEQGDYEKAYSLYKQLGDVEALAQIINQHGLSLMRSGREVTLGEWAEDIPDTMLEKYPFLLCLFGNVSMILSEMHQSQLYLTRAEQIAHKNNDAELLARALVWDAARLRFIGDYSDSLAKADEVLALEQKNEEVKADALRARGLALHRKGHITASVESLEQSLDLYQRLEKLKNVAMSQVDLGIAYQAMGRYTLATKYYNLALGYWRNIGNTNWLSTLHNNLGCLEHEQGNFLQAKAHFDQAISQARKINYAYMEGISLISLGDLYCDLDAPEAAREVYGPVQQLAQQIQSSFLLFYLYLAEARMSSSLLYLDQAEQLARQHDSAHEQGLVALLRGKFGLKNRDPQAATHFKQAAQSFEQGGQIALAVQSYLLLSITDSAALDKAAELALQLDTWQPLVLVLRDVKAALPEKHPFLQKLSPLLTQFEQSIPSLHRQLRQQSVGFEKPPLSIKTLGRFQVVANNKTLGYDWKRTASRDMFLYLLDGRRLSKEELSELLWPDSNLYQNRSRFKNTVFYLRSVLGADVVLRDEAEQYYFNRAIDYEYDKEEFERLIEAGELDRAIALYKGAYLPGIDAWWVQAERERLQQLFQNAAAQLARQNLQDSKYTEALAYCRLILDQNPHYEEAYRLTMQTYHALGDHAAIQRQFERCRDILANDLGITVSPQTQELYNQLVH